MNWIIYGMIYAGSILMAYNIWNFFRFCGHIQEKRGWGEEKVSLYGPGVLLVMFLLGYLGIGFIGKPDLLVSGILFGGSVFVFVVIRLLWRIFAHIRETEKIEARLQAAEASSQAKSSFLATMSHEMRTPMNAIIGLDTIILKDESLKEQTRKRLENIGISARHLLDLNNEVLDMNYIESGKLVIKKEPFSLREMLELIYLVTQEDCDEKHLNFVYEEKNISVDSLLGDSLHLRQSLLMILENAVKFTSEPGTVSFLTEQTEGDGEHCTLRFTIRDTGIGIDESFLPRIFDSFSQEDSGSTNAYGGSGLGLAITKRLVDGMAGEISVSSRKGEGSTFTVTVSLPVAAVAKKEKADSPSENESYDLSNCRVLIVEDIDLNAEIVADLLEMEGIASERAQNGQEAVDMFRANPKGYYDAILMDLRMPVMDGLNASRTIRALDREDAASIPIIALTANCFEEDIQRSREAGMNAHLPKPVDSGLLFETLAALIKGDGFVPEDAANGAAAAASGNSETV